MKAFYTIEELKQELSRDKAHRDRFPVRFILIKGRDNWHKVVTLLEDMADYTYKLSERCSGEDTIPNLSDLTTKIKCHSYSNMLVIPLAEYLRIFENRRTILRELATIERTEGINNGTKCRAYIPLFEIENIFFEQMKGVSRFNMPGECAKYFSIKNTGEDDKVSLQIMPQNIETSILYEDVIRGIKQYMQIWEKASRQNSFLITGFAQAFKETAGDYCIRICNSNFELLKNHIVGCDELKMEWGKDEQWGWLLSQANRGEHLNNLFLRVFNLAGFNVKSLFANWKEYDENQKWLAWVWCKIEQPDGYMEYVMRNSNNYTSLKEDIINGVFDINEKGPEAEKAILEERKQFLEYIGIYSIPNTFWEKFNSIDDNIQKLKCLSCITKEEKYKAIEIIKELLINNIDEEKWYDYLSVVYPELAYYMCTADYNSSTVYTYFYNYTRAKLTDMVNDIIHNLMQDVADNEIFWQYHPRNSLLEEIGEQRMVYWVDGMGAEWLGLIDGILSNEFPDIEYEYKIARANLPTITEYNKGWEGTDNYRIYKDFDSAVHNYACSYPEYIIEEFRHIREIIRNAVNLLNSYSSVVITSDHGTSRLAAISKQKSTPLPERIKVEKYGRYCINDGSLNVTDYTDCIEQEDKLIFKTYGRFSIGGHIAGEIHGGATLEEILVPVIIIRKKSEENRVITFSLHSSTIRLNAKNEAVLNLTLSDRVEKLSLVIRSVRFEARYKDNKWEIALKNLKPGQYRGTLWADNKNIGKVTFELTKGITINDMGL